MIGGDGIGPEVTAEALKVLRAAGVALDTTEFDLGGQRYLRDGEILSDATLDELRAFDAILLGAVGTPEVPPGVIERGLLLKMRFELDLYVNQRPFTAPTATTSSSSARTPRGRTSARAGCCGRARRTRSPRRAASTPGWASSAACATPSSWPPDRPRRHLTLVHKTNVLTFAGDLWQRTFDEVGAEFPDVATAYHHVDAATIYFVQDPQRYDVIVTDNLFGDILTDLGGAVSGGIGLASSANLNPARTGPSMFEPVHGSAPDIAGTGHRRPAGGDPVGGADARLPRRGRRRRPDPRRLRRAGCRQHHAVGDAIAAV